ncbi:2-desacetyl-2-hydroxyethyl bacteriochlorophyllide A dehydrogenase [Desulfotomaculum arcticum]|uniref:2-desacetyl-2-hydroxyethyl bacteriochlorophyllide A dehydrogenase n=1 Tax=Desulfotruncus arcticus DSM 17038 TaxID=1121424 RepID=A0A1I2XU54_9FIRM|nr:zinc-dependent dehydrogenase [Desulfotruncus arcticus]SFH15641.1 2-desacetyl-2-hydroxyethyl bacteriochlorophyllide A dehydrogenase [Desulfotomaculum arcticum] [Desulfotruncus arcticus DSM 17038]
MKAAVVYGINDIRIQEVARPEPGAGEVVVKVRASGICATDVKMLLGQGLPKNLPAILGHEVAGEIFSVGPEVVGLQPGQRVAVYPIAVCGDCYFCRRGRHNLCEREFGLAHGIDGGFAEYVRIPRQIIDIQGVCELSPSIAFEQAAMAEPLSCCLAAARQGKVQSGDTVAIVGAGPMGLFHLKVARHLGARAIVADLNHARLDIARRMGADLCINTQRNNFIDEVRRFTEGRGADMVIAALGIPPVMEQCLPAVRQGGTFNIFGGPPAGQQLTIDPRWLHYGEINLTGTFASTPLDFQRALAAITSGEIEVRDMISHRFKLDNMLDAVEQVRKQSMIKGVVIMD